MSRKIKSIFQSFSAKPKQNYSAVVGALMCLGAYQAAVADTIFLDSGEQVSGMITLEDNDYISIMNEDRMVFRFNKAKVTDIKREAGAFSYEMQGDKDFEQNLYQDALLKYETAIALGGDRKEITPKIEKVQDAIIDAEFGGLAVDLRKARTLARNEKFEEAEMTIRKMVESAGDDQNIIPIACQVMGDVLVAKARFMVDNIKYKDAEIEYQKAIVFDPENPAIYKELGELYSRKSITHNKAVQNFLMAIKVGEDKLSEEELNELNYETAELYFENGFYEEAATHYRTVYKTDPIFSLSLSGRLIDSLTQLAAKGELENRAYAIEALTEAAEIAPENAEVRELLADLLTIEEDFDEAIFYYKSALDISSNRKDTNEKIAYIYRATRLPEEEEKHLLREVLIDPEDYASICNLGDVQWKLGEWDDATEQYRLAQELDPDNPRALVALASSERKLGNYGEARKTIQQIIDRYPDDIRAQLEMGLVFLDEKKYSAAEPFFTETLKLIKETPLDDKLEENELIARAYTSRGEVNLNVSGPSTAINDFEKALEVINDYPAAFFQIGEAFHKKYSSSSALADLMKAEENMLRARLIDDKNAEYALGLGLFYHKTLAQEDRPNEAVYQKKALEQYRHYVDLGGAQIEQVQDFIRELTGNQDVAEEIIENPSEENLEETIEELVDDPEGVDDIEETDEELVEEPAETENPT